MKLLGRNKAPERLRASVDAAGGSVEMRVSAILRPLGFNSTAPLAIAAGEQVLERAGLVAMPPIAESGWDDAVTVAVSAQTEQYEPAPVIEEQEEPVSEQIAEVEEMAQDDAIAAAAAEIVAEEPTSDGDVVDEAQVQRQRELEQRLQALVEQERGASEKAQAEAERRIAEAAQVLDEARRASEGEAKRRAQLERELTTVRKQEDAARA